MLNRKFFKIGQNYFIRTMMMYYVGKLVDIEEEPGVGITGLVLSEASWIPITGRLHRVLVDGILNEVEPYKDDIYVSATPIVDATPWDHPLPREPKPGPQVKK